MGYIAIKSNLSSYAEDLLTEKLPRLIETPCQAPENPIYILPFPTMLFVKCVFKYMVVTIQKQMNARKWYVYFSIFNFISHFNIPII